jgi:DNA/RNA-binding domain of Phe-tRNA-synthetase-like protein
MACVNGSIQLRLTTGGERFHPLGAVEPKAVHEGEYAYVDDSNDILCRLDVRQAEKTKITMDTRECFYIVQGNPNTPSSLVRATAEHLITLTKRYCGGEERMLTERGL